MHTAAAMRAKRALDQHAQLAGSLDTIFAARLDDSARDAARHPLFAVFAKDAGQLGFGLLIYNVVGAELGALIHPHVERTVMAEAEAARGIIERETAHAQIDED